jgi:hypothetical protein
MKNEEQCYLTLKISPISSPEVLSTFFNRKMATGCRLPFNIILFYFILFYFVSSEYIVQGFAD